jgi:hypothetical protein
MPAVAFVATVSALLPTAPLTTAFSGVENFNVPRPIAIEEVSSLVAANVHGLPAVSVSFTFVGVPVLFSMS